MLVIKLYCKITTLINILLIRFKNLLNLSLQINNDKTFFLYELDCKSTNLTKLINELLLFNFQPTPRWLSVFTTLRILFIPLFLLCNYHPLGKQRTLPVLINNDWVYWVLAIIMGWSSGHGSSLGMMYVSG